MDDHTYKKSCDTEEKNGVLTRLANFQSIMKTDIYLM